MRCGNGVQMRPFRTNHLLSLGSGKWGKGISRDPIGRLPSRGYGFEPLKPQISFALLWAPNWQYEPLKTQRHLILFLKSSLILRDL